jgi:hypothetical protein
MFAVAIGLLLVTAVYFAVTTLVDLAPLNNVTSATRREQLTEVSINGPILTIPVVLVALAAVLHRAPLGYLGGAIELVFALNGLALWWLPYLVAVTVPWATAGTNESWPQLHARTYAKTIILLPKIAERPRPNLEHMILHALRVAGGVCALAYSAGN